MSRVGLKPIKIPENVEINFLPNLVEVKNSENKNSVVIPSCLSVEQKDNQLFITRKQKTKIAKSLHGTVRSLLENAINGLSEDYTKKLEIVGIGYRANTEEDKLILQVGYTHPRKLNIPTGIKVSINKNIISISGHDKSQVGQFSAEVRSIKPPEPYKGKGIRYHDERIKMKQGKAIKTGE